MVYHLLTEHTQIDISGGYQLPFFLAKLMLTMFISRLEESLMGIEVASTLLNRQMNFSTSNEAGGSNYGGTQMLVFQHEKIDLIHLTQ